MEKTTHIVIVGAGYAGVAAGKHLGKAFKKSENIKITLIDKHPYHTLMTELHEVAGGRVDQTSVQINLKKIFAGTKVDPVLDKVKSIDFEKKHITADRSCYSYDYLLLCVGAESEDFGVPGIAENAFSLWSFEDALILRHHIEEMFLQASSEPDPDVRKRLLSFVVAGAGFTGVEMMGELVEWKKYLSHRYLVNADEVSFTLVEAMNTVIPILPEDLQLKTKQYLEKQGVNVILGARITKCDGDSFEINKETVIETRTLIWTCGINGSETAANMSLIKGRCNNRLCHHARENGTCGTAECEYTNGGYLSGKRGRLVSDDYMRAAGKEDVFLAGDVLWHVEKSELLPQIVETAIQTGETAAHNIVSTIRNKTLKKHQSNYHGLMVSVGSKWGVAHFGKNFKLRGLMAIAVKHLVNLHYLFDIGGLNVIWAYLQHEFLSVEDKRSITRGLLSHKVPNYWVTVLRMFTGSMWLIEGIKKIMDGWLDKANAVWINRFMFGISPPASPETDAVSDAVTAATEAAAEIVAEPVVEAVTAASEAAVETAAETAVEVVSAASEAVTDLAVTGTEAVVDLALQAERAANAAGGMFFPAVSKPWPIYEWFIRLFVGDGSTGVQLWFADLFRIGVVLGEIAIGLALIGGLFTFLSAGASLVLCVMFIASGMATREIFWFMFAAIAFLGGAGRGLGLDHWVMPWLKDRWNRIPLAHRTKLYLGEPVFGKRSEKKERKNRGIV